MTEYRLEWIDRSKQHPRACTGKLCLFLVYGAEGLHLCSIPVKPVKTLSTRKEDAEQLVVKVLDLVPYMVKSLSFFRIK